MAPLTVDPLSYPKAHHSGGHCRDSGMAGMTPPMCVQ